MKYFSIALFCLLLALSCSDNNTDSNDSKKEIWPLAVGNKWTYASFSYYNSNTDSIRYNDTIVFFVSSSRIIDGVEWFAFGILGEAPNTYMTNKSDGVWDCDKLEDTLDFNPQNTSLHFKYPTIVGEYNPKDSSIYKTISINDLIKTPAGSFNCVRYIRTTNVSNSIFLSPNIGLVKSERITNIDPNTNDTTWAGQILISYELKKK